MKKESTYFRVRKNSFPVAVAVRIPSTVFRLTLREDMMIKAYVVGISTHYEGEDIEIQYSIYNDQELLCKRSVIKEYKKPSVVSHEALVTLLKELKKYKGKEIVIEINDASLYQQIKGTSQTKKPEVLRMASRVQKELNRFGDSITIIDVSNDSPKLRDWRERLRF
jgi:hypothetical protein